MNKHYRFLLLSTSLLFPMLMRAAEPIRVLIVDGEQVCACHKWQALTPALKKELDETGLFVTDIATAPSTGTPADFHPEWSKYQVVVFNIDVPDARWSPEMKAAFEDYMKKGGGLVTVHAADNGFPDWPAFNQMIGVAGWHNRDEKSGKHWYYQGGKLVGSDAPGKAGSHGSRIPFVVTVQQPEHPIMKGLPATWMHQGDELYANLRGPGGMTVLATAHSDTTNRGTGFDEPQLMVSSFGKGRIFHSTFGHDVFGLASVDAVVTFQRGVEWAGTGKVTQKVPTSFPTANTVSFRSDIAAMDPNASKGMNPLDQAVQQRGPASPGGARGAGPTPAPDAPKQ